MYVLSAERAFGFLRWLKLLLCVAIDLAGDATFLLPGLGELGDLAFAPFEARPTWRWT